MADEVKPEGTDKGAAPVFDEEALAEKVAAKMKASAGDWLRREPEHTPQPQPAGPPPQADPLADYVRNVVGGDMRAINTRAEAAEDKAGFYSDSDDAELKAEYRNEVEDLFQKNLRAGRPLPRQDILNFIKGRDLSKLVEKAETRKKKKLDEASAAATVGESGRRDMGGSTGNQNWHELGDQGDDGVEKIKNAIGSQLF